MKKIYLLLFLSMFTILSFITFNTKVFAYTQEVTDFYFDDVGASESISGGDDYVGVTLTYSYDADYQYIINIEKNPDNATMFSLFGNQNLTITVIGDVSTTYYDSYTLDGYLYGFYLHLDNSEFAGGEISFSITADSIDFPGDSGDIETYMTGLVKIYRISNLWVEGNYPPGMIYYYYYQSFGILQPEYVADENYLNGFDDGYLVGYDSGVFDASADSYALGYGEGQDDMYDNGSGAYGYLSSSSYDYTHGYDAGQLIMFNNGSDAYGFDETDSYDYIKGQDDLFDNGSTANGYVIADSYDYIAGKTDGSAVNVNAGITNFMSDFDKWIVPAIVLVILLGGFTTIMALKRKNGGD